MHYYYAVLGLPITASLEDIKKAYRRLAKTYHPDIVGDDPQSVARFQQIGQAYEILLAEKTRPSYYYPHGYPPYPPTPQQPQGEQFKSYTWETVSEEPPPPPKPPKPKPPPPKPPPPPEPPPPPIRGDILPLCQQEASQEAFRRCEKEDTTPLAELEEKIDLYLREDFQVSSSPQGFMVTSQRTGRKISFAQGKGFASFFGGGNKPK